MFTNRDDLDFAAVADLPPTQSWELTENLDGRIELPTQVCSLELARLPTCIYLLPGSWVDMVRHLRQCTHRFEARAGVLLFGTLESIRSAMSG